jgi:hypothetical protein
MSHSSEKEIVVSEVIKLIANQFSIPKKNAETAFNASNTALILDDDRTGLYKQGPLYVFSLFIKEHNKILQEIDQDEFWAKRTCISDPKYNR